MFRLFIVLVIGLPCLGFGQTFSGQVFQIAKDFATDKCQVFAECDCCTSDIFFLSADRFCFVNRCLTGDSYYKGTYAVKPNRLELTLDKKYINEVTDEDYNVITFDLKEKNSDPILFDIVECGQRIRLTHPTVPEWKNGGRYERKQEIEEMSELKASKIFKLLFQ